MNPTEALLSQVNALLKAMREPELALRTASQPETELELALRVKEAYLIRLLKQRPEYRTLPPRMLPDMFWQALLRREDELQTKPQA